MRNKKSLKGVMICLIAGLLILWLGINLYAAITETQIQPPDRKLQSYAPFFSARASSGTSDALDITGYDQGTFAVFIRSGSATITPQLSQDGSVYYDLAYVTTSSFVNYAGVFRSARVKITGCSNCNVDVTWMGDNR